MHHDDHNINFEYVLNVSQFAQADFKGKSALLAEKKAFTLNRLVMLEIEMPDGAKSKVWPEGNLSVWSAGRVVGNVTSGTYSPATNKGENFFARQL